MTVALRGHHLICVLTFCGRGYTPAFTENMIAIVDALSAGATVRIAAGADAICAPLKAGCGVDIHCGNADVAGRDERALRAVSGVLGRSLQPGDKVRFDKPTLAALRAAFSDGRLAGACAGCPWQDFCNTVATTGFAATRLTAAPDLLAETAGAELLF